MKRLAIFIVLLLPVWAWAGAPYDTIFINGPTVEMTQLHAGNSTYNYGTATTCYLGSTDISSGYSYTLLFRFPMISDSLALPAYSGMTVDSMIAGIKAVSTVGSGESLLVTSYIIKKKGWQEGIGNAKDTCGADWSWANDTTNEPSCSGDSLRWSTAGARGSGTDYVATHLQLKDISGTWADDFDITSGGFPAYDTLLVMIPGQYVDEMDSLGFIIFETDIDQSDNVCTARFYSDDGSAANTPYCRIFLSTPPDSTPDSLMVTTWHTERYDSAGYGYSNPDPNISEQGLTSLEPRFSVMSGEQDTIWAYNYQINVNDSTDGDSLWCSGIVAFGDTFDSDTRSPKIAFNDTTIRRLQYGRIHYWRIQLYSGADTTPSGWSAWNSFKAWSPTEWWNEDYLYRKQVWFDSSHSYVSSYVPLRLNIKTGNGIEYADMATNDRWPTILYDDGFTYVCGLDTASRYDVPGVSKSAAYFIKKYNNATGEMGERTIFARYISDNHALPELGVTDNQLHIFIGGHNNTGGNVPLYFVCDSSVTDSGFILESMRNRCDTATATGPDSGLINTTADWDTNELKRWWVHLRPGITTGDAIFEKKEILSNNGGTLYVASDWTDPPVAGDEYYVYYPLTDEAAYATYPFPKAVGDSLYMFFRNSGEAIADDSTGDADGVHTDSTLQDSAKAWVVNCFKGWQIINLTDADTAIVESNTADVINVEGTWTVPEDNDNYKLRYVEEGILSYIRLDPYADSINVAFSTAQNVIFYSDHPADYTVNGPVVYGSAFHNDLNDNRDIYVSAVFWDYYGNETKQGGRAITVMKSTLDDGWFDTWTNMAGDTIGYSFEDNLYHTDSTINKAACDLIDTSATTSVSLGSANMNSVIVADTNGNVYISYGKFKYADQNYALCALYTARYYNDAWDIDEITGASDSLINFRLGGQLILENNEITVYGSIWSQAVDTNGTALTPTEYTGELKRWSATLNTDSLLWVGEMVTKNSMHGCGRLVTVPLVYPGANKLLSYQRDNLLYLIDGSNWPYMQSDGDDGRIVFGYVNANSTVGYTQMHRRPEHTWGADTTDVLFTIPGTVLEDSINIPDFFVEWYYKNRLVDDAPNRKVHSSQGIYQAFSGLEGNATGTAIDDETYWELNSGRGTIYDYLTGWIYNVFEGKNYCLIDTPSVIRYYTSPTLGANYKVGVNLFQASVIGKIWLEIKGHDGQVRKIGIGQKTANSSGVLYNLTSGWVLSDTLPYLGYNKIELLVGGLLPTGAYGLYGYANKRLIFSSDETDTLETGSVTTSDDDKIIDVNGNWIADSRNGMFVKITSGTYSDSVREITDTKTDTLYFTALPGNLGVGVTYTVWDTTVGIYIGSNDSLGIGVDTTTGTGFGLSNIFDGFYVQKSYLSFSSDPMTLIPSSAQYRRQENAQIIFIGGD